MALVIGRVEPVENVAGHVVLQQRQHQSVILLVPLLGGPLGGAQGQLLWRTKRKFSQARLQVVVLKKKKIVSACFITIFNDDLQNAVLITASGTGKDLLHIIPS